MNEIANARINTLPSMAPMEAQEQPSEEIFVLTAPQLSRIIQQAVQEATERLYLEIAYDRQRIAKLEQREPQPLQKDRAQVLRAILLAHGGKMLGKEARKLMHLPENIFSELLKSCDFIETRPYHLNRRQLLLIIK